VSNSVQEFPWTEKIHKLAVTDWFLAKLKHVPVRTTFLSENVVLATDRELG